MAMSKAKFIQAIGDRASLTQVQAGAVFDAVVSIVAEQLRDEGEFNFPMLAKFKIKTTPAKPERQCRNFGTGEMIKVPAKPEGRKLQVRWVQPAISIIGLTKLTSG